MGLLADSWQSDGEEEKLALVTRWMGREDAIYPGGLKDEVRTPQTHAQRSAHTTNPQQAFGVGSAFSTPEEPHPLVGPAGVRKTPKTCSGVEDWRKPSGKDTSHYHSHLPFYSLYCHRFLDF